MKFELNGRCSREDHKPRRMEIAHFIASFPGPISFVPVVEDICYGEFIGVQEYVDFVMIRGEMLNWGLISWSQSVWLVRTVSRLPLFLTGGT